MTKGLLRAGVAALSIACVQPVFAQDAKSALPQSMVDQVAEADAARQSGVATAPGDIIVTARKRQESVLKVPVIETVLNAEAFQRNQIVNIQGITQQVPGLQIGQNVLTVGTQIAIRGVGTSSLDAGVDQSVSLNIDGLQFSQGTAFGIGLFDVAQVEVLKGPQALFFGKNSPAGVIAIRTADPGSELEVIGRAIYGVEAQEKRGELIVSAPFSDTLGIRLAAAYTDDNGYFFNRATALPGTGAKNPSSRRYNAIEEYILRATIVWKPTSDFSARFKINNSVRDIIGGAAPYGSCPDGTGAPIGIQFINPAENCKVDRIAYIVDIDPAAFPNIRNNGVPFIHNETSFGTVELNYDFTPAVSLTSTTGYLHIMVDGLLNGVSSGFAGPTLYADNHFRRRDFTQELRLQSDFNDSPLNFLLGGFYQRARLTNRVFVGGNTTYRLPPTLTGGINDVGIRVFSGFGQLRYKPAETLEIAGGVRYADERRHNDTSRITSIYAAPTPTQILRPTLRSRNWSPEVTITYTPTDDLTIFGALKQGYKSGSFILTSPPPLPLTPQQIAAGRLPADTSFGDERVRGGEVGVKLRTPDRAFTANTAFYYYRYQGLQVGANEVAVGGIPVIRTINAASANVYGVDFDATYAPPSIEGLTARLAVNWNHARFAKFDNAQCYGGQRFEDGCNQFLNPVSGLYQAQDLSGVRLPKASDWQVNGGVDYTRPIGGRLRLGLGTNAQYTSKYLTNLGNRADYYQRGFVKVNANVSVGADNDAWEVAVIGNNLFNKFTTGNCTNFSGATGQILLSPITGASATTPGGNRNAAGIDELVCIPDRGREVFLRLTLRPTAFGR